MDTKVIVQEKDPFDMVKAIDAKAKEGFIPVGECRTTALPVGALYTQMMIKPENEEEGFTAFPDRTEA